MSREIKQRPGRLTAGRHRLLDELLDQILDLEPPDRLAHVNRLASRYPRLGRWLHRLLGAVSESTGFLDQPAHDLIYDALQARMRRAEETLEVGGRLGPWRVVEHIGSGGMGEVYRGERSDGSFQMPVAIKVIGSPSRELGELLVAERQAMARLNHASIARLIDGGKTENGQPYLVMEWVEGRLFGDWIGDADPGPCEMLRLFVQACTAVAAAHRQLIVHGDIKPSNLLVEDTGDLKLLDFGVARLLDASTVHDLPRALTPGFAAPEQMQGEPIATAADIYALGALLHWMVYGNAPGSGERREPLPAWCEYNRMKDLRAIIDQATAIEPDNRYATVNAMLLELGRLRADRPIRARRPGPIERFSLWTRRHTVGATLGAVALVSILVGLSMFFYQARLVAVERDVARTEAALSEAVREHLVFLFREVGSLAGDTRELTARELLDQTAEVAADWLKEDPELQRQVLAVLGEIMIGLHDYNRAEPLLAQFLDEDAHASSPVLRSIALRDLAQTYHRRGRLDDAMAAIEQSASLIRELPGEHPARYADIIQIRGRINRDRGNWEMALDDLKQARELSQQASTGPMPLMARAENNLATTLLMSGQLAESVRHFEAAEALWYSLGRSESNDALSVMSNLAVTLDRLGRTAEAEQRLRRVIEMRRQHFGDSGALAAAHLQLGRLLVVSGRHEEGEQHLDRALETFVRFVGEGSPDHGASLIGLGELARAQGDFEQALRYFQRADQIMNDTVGSRHPYAMQSHLGLVRTKRRLEPSYQGGELELLEAQAREMGGAGSMVLAAIRCEQAMLHVDQGEYPMAAGAAQECLELRENLGFGGWRATEARLLGQLATLLQDDRSGQVEECRRTLEQMIEQTHAGHPLVLEVRSRIGDLLAESLQS